MRHSDPHRTAQIYTDVSQLPTFDAVATLPWIDQKDTQIDPQNTVSKGQNLSQTVNKHTDTKNSEAIKFQSIIPALSHNSPHGQMAEREGFEPSVELPPHILSRDAHSATLSPLLFKNLRKIATDQRSTEIVFNSTIWLLFNLSSGQPPQHPN